MQPLGGLHLNIAEAQHAGVPVVAFKVGAHPEVVNAGNTGLLVETVYVGSPMRSAS